MFGGAKEYCPNFRILGRKPFVRQTIHEDQKKGKKSNSDVFHSVTFGGVETSAPEFTGILPGFSTNQNFWGCACILCTHPSYTIIPKG